jgi:hypothetical protein
MGSSPRSGAKKKKVEQLYNKIVTVDDLPPCYPYRFWFVITYVYGEVSRPAGLLARFQSYCYSAVPFQNHAVQQQEACSS